MAIFNRILLFLIMVLAIAAAGLSYLLFQNRNAMRDRADLLAETVTDMAQTLDKQSQTGIADDVTFEPRVPETGEADTGALSWATFMEGKEDEFAGFIATLKKAENLADKVIKQRNEMAKSMREIGETLGSQEPQIADQLMNAKKMDQAEEVMDGIESLANSIRKRDIDMIDGYGLIAKALDVNLRTTAFTTRGEERDEEGNVYYGGFEHAGEIGKVTDAVSGIGNRARDFSEALAGVIRRIPAHDWSVSPFAVTDKSNYERALTSMVNDLESINSALIVSQQRQQQIDKLQSELDKVEEKLASTAKQRDALAKKTANLEETLDAGGVGTTTAQDDVETVEDDGTDGLSKELEGNVVYVNENFGFIVMDIGAKNSIRDGMELLVARDGEYIGRVVVTDVRLDQAVAELTPSGLVGMAKVGDRIIPTQELVK